MNPVLRGLLPAIARRIAAAIIAGLMARGWLEIDPGSLTATQERLAETIVNLLTAMLAVYAVVANGLKPWAFRKFGELLPGDVAPDTHDREVAKVEAERQPEPPTTTELIRQIHDEPPERL